MFECVRAERPGVTIEFRPPLVDELSIDADDTVVAAGDRDLLGHLTTERIDLTVPGGARLTAATIRSVEVDPDHTRQGILTGLVRQSLDEARERGQVLAVIDEPPTTLFDRFGFAVATELCRVSIDAERARPIHRGGEVELEVIPAQKAGDVLPDAHPHCARERSGSTSRSTAAWDRLLAPLGVNGEPMLVVHRDSTGLIDAYALAEIAPPDGRVVDMAAASAELERRMWSHLVEMVEVVTWTAERRPLDDLVRLSVADPRAYATHGRSDGTWLRVLDTDVALGARTYGSTIANVTMRVDDPWFHANTGTWRIDSYGSFRSQTSPDLTASIAELSAVYLGGVSWQGLRDAGRVIEHRAGAAAEADILFGVRPLPFDR